MSQAKSNLPEISVEYVGSSPSKENPMELKVKFNHSISDITYSLYNLKGDVITSNHIEQKTNRLKLSVNKKIKGFYIFVFLNKSRKLIHKRVIFNQSNVEVVNHKIMNDV